MPKPTRRVPLYARVSTDQQITINQLKRPRPSPSTASSSDKPTTAGNSASPAHIER